MNKETEKKIDDIFNKSTIELLKFAIALMRHNTVSFCSSPWILVEIYKEERYWILKEVYKDKK